MKNFIYTVIAVSLSLPVMAQKTPPTKTKSTSKTEVVNNSNDKKNKEVSADNDSTKLEIKMDKPLEIYFDSLYLSKEQVEKIRIIDELMNSRKEMSRAKIKMTKEEIANEESEDLKFRNLRIYDILTPKQVKEIYLLQNGKLKEKLSALEILDFMDLKPLQIEQINKIKSQFKIRFEEANKIEDEVDRLNANKIVNLEMEKELKGVLKGSQLDYFEGVNTGKIEIDSDKLKKAQEVKKVEDKGKE